MKVLISIGLWGHSYAELFAGYALASQLSGENIPRLAISHDITYQIVTTRADRDWLRDQPAIQELGRHAAIEWDLLEDLGYDPNLLPTGPEGIKYTFLSVIQNMAIERSLQHDALIFNYADFIWANGSLTKAIENLKPGVDAVLSFCLPVDQTQAVTRLDEVRASTGTAPHILHLDTRRGAAIAIDCLHREAKLRYWDDPPFTITPTYLLWKVEDEGILIRAYHQTILAMRVKHDDPEYRAGIAYGSLDGHFTALLAERENTYHATNSDDVLVFSLYDTIVESQIGGPSRQQWKGFDRDVSMRECLRNVITPSQRKFGLIPIELRRDYRDPERWSRVEVHSREMLLGFHLTSPFDQEEYDSMHKPDGAQNESRISLSQFMIADSTEPDA